MLIKETSPILGTSPVSTKSSKTAFQMPWGILLKCLFSVGLIGWLFTKIDTDKVLEAITQVHGGVLGGILLLLWATIFVIAKRWQLIVRLTDKNVPYRQLSDATFIGAFFNQFLPSSVGGDFFRMLAVRRHHISLNEAVTSVLLDRAFGFLSLGFLCVLAIPVDGHHLMNSALKWPFLMTLSLLAGVIAGGIFLMFIPKKWLNWPFMRPLIPLTEMIHRMLTHKMLTVKIFASSLLGSILLITGLQILMMALDIPLTWGQGAAILPVVMLLASLPISFAGWGLREGAMIVALGIYGVSTELALAISLIYGVMHLVSGVPGLILWIAARNKGLSVSA